MDLKKLKIITLALAVSTIAFAILSIVMLILMFNEIVSSKALIVIPCLLAIISSFGYNSYRGKAKRLEINQSFANIKSNNQDKTSGEESNNNTY